MSLPHTLAWVDVLTRPLNRDSRQSTCNYTNVTLGVDLNKRLLFIGSKKMQMDLRTMEKLKTLLDAEFARWTQTERLLRQHSA